jgi:hypothetical protein
VSATYVVSLPTGQSFNVRADGVMRCGG